MKTLFALMLIVSFIAAAFFNKMSDLTNAALNSCVEAVDLFLYLIGGMCMWGGVMRIADRAGITRLLSKLFRPAAKRLFTGIDPEGEAMGLITMNVAANILGLGNAATPIGISAIQSMEREQRKKGLIINDTATRDMTVFIVLNTASITLIPQTAASIRLLHGAARPFDIFPCVIVTTAAALTMGIIAARIRSKDELH
jgi:spore maturation protein A